MVTETSANNFLFDLIATQPVDGAEFHGGGKYAKMFFFALVKLYSQDPRLNWRVYALYDSRKVIESEIIAFAEENAIQLVDIKDKPLISIISEFSISRFYTALPFILGPFGLFDIIDQQKCQIYCTIHGLRPLEILTPVNALGYLKSPYDKLKLLAKILLRGKLYKRDFDRFSKLIEKSNILAVSNHTKYSIMSFFNKQENDIRVFYSPDVTEFATEPSTINNVAAENKYFFLVSGNRWLKNNLISVQALDQLFSSRKDLTHNVVITGVSDPQIYLSKIHNKDRFTFLKYISETELAAYYKHAYALIYMSLNEGFGYPPLEAMKWHVPVLTSPYTSIPEVCGDAVLYSDPYSISEIKSRLLQLLNDESHSILAMKGRKRYEMVYEKQVKDLHAGVQYLLEG